MRICAAGPEFTVDIRVFLAESIRRVAYLQPSLKTVIYQNLWQIKQDNRTLPQETPDTPEARAHLFEYRASLEERIEAITRTIGHFERMVPRQEAVANQRKRPRGP